MSELDEALEWAEGLNKDPKMLCWPGPYGQNLAKEIRRLQSALKQSREENAEIRNHYEDLRVAWRIRAEKAEAKIGLLNKAWEKANNILQSDYYGSIDTLIDLICEVQDLMDDAFKAAQ